MNLTTGDPGQSRVLLALNIAAVWPMALAAIGSIVGVPAAVIVPVFSVAGEWQDIPTLLPPSIFYGAATGAAYGVVVAAFAALIASRHTGEGYVEAVRVTCVLVAGALFLGAAVAFNDTGHDRVAFIGLYGLPVVLGTWLAWRATPAIVDSYRHRMR